MEAKEAVAQLLELLDQTDYRNLSAALRRVLDGERNAEALAEAHNLDGEDYIILCKVLEVVRGARGANG